jgi:molybdopterin synthase sulfur carrier subunit
VIRVLLFGRLRDVAGWRERAFESVATLSALKAAIRREHAGLADALEGPGIQAAVDQVLARGDLALRAGMEVAFLPPMSGG